ncbi:hypothetical protein AURDEDRAFT_112965 [Auricularia subglabra TFB-10046 SS5]|nr:hypothetical protein AURDEDRAFT_112965 [Auricularia subglabra TFB-10046 SS5]
MATSAPAPSPGAPGAPRAPAPPAGPPPAMMALIKLRNWQNEVYPQNMWWTVVAFIVLFTLAYIWARGARALRKYRSLHQRLYNYDNRPAMERLPNPNGPVAIRRVPLAIANGFRILAFRWTLPLSSATLADTFITLFYTFMMLLLVFVDTKGLNMMLWGSRSAAMAISQLPLMPVLSGKNNIISFLTGISHEKLMFVHRAAGRNILLLLWIHGGAKWSAGVRFTTLPLKCGAVALGALTLSAFLSLRPIRKAIYEFFLASHILLIGTVLIAGSYHAQKLHESGSWLWVSMAFWAADRLFRLARTIYTTRPWSSEGSSEASIELLSNDTVRVRMKRPMDWRAGQHAFLTLPGVSSTPLEAHPFTIATIPDPPRREATRISGPRELSFIIKGRGGFTNRLLTQAQFSRGTGRNIVTAFVDGPYGSPPDLTAYSTAILIAGGSGVSYTISMLENLIQQARKNTSAVKRVAFIWSIRDEDNLGWIHGQLCAALACVPGDLSVAVRIFVTRPPANLATRLYESSTTLHEKDMGMLQKSALSSMGDVRVDYGRPNIHAIIAEEVCHSTGSVSVDVSGPAPLIESVRSATRASDIAGPGGIARGMPSISLHVEEFCM